MVGLMREGNLLAEMNPTQLLGMYQSNSIEEVFFKLSKEDSVEKPTASVEISSSQLDISIKDVNTNKEPINEFVLNEKVQEGCNRQTVQETQMNLENILPYTKNNMIISKYYNITRKQQLKRKISRLQTLVRKQFMLLKINPWITLFMLLIPTFQIILYSSVLGGKLTNLPVAIVNMGNKSSFSKTFLEKIDNTVITQVPYSNITLAIESVKSGKTWGAVHIKSNFSRSLLKRYLECAKATNETIMGSSIDLYLDMTNIQAMFAIQYTMLETFQKFAKYMLTTSGQNPLLVQSPFIIKEPIYGSKNASFRDFILPNIMQSCVLFGGIIMTIMSIIIDSKSGLIHRVTVAGVKFSEIVLSVLINMTTIVILQVCISIGIIILIFHLHVYGSIFLVFISTVISGICGLSIGILTSTVCESELFAVLIAFIVYTPNFVFGGIFWPLEGMPYYLQYFCYIWPQTILVEATRNIWLKGGHFFNERLLTGIGISLTWTIITLFLSILIFKRKK